ncbi:LRR receptor-like serine/threonine-protein kinase RGI2 [Gnomoniopsis smithogilvyi]|uniref:LRR receptor-like serine/threonine-protein kinase RGI2 n=1 Tax=Gnomoniopsis smithogilvyi TaxID=1191159 RepID=A0A9W8YTV3_9PEZI|nr:LRR receptor-like serine/threonine-protein kinase RGI2 [Gnomoniopsis smithogilvyi]
MVVTITIPPDDSDNNHNRKNQSIAKENKTEKPRNKYLQFLSEQWLVFCFGMATLLAWRWPDFAATGGPIRPEFSILYGSVAIIFLISGLQLSTKKLRANLFNWRLHLIVQGISFIIIPVIWLTIMWIIIAAGDLRTQVVDTSVLIGMLVTSCLPTTIASNIVMTRNAGGDDAAAIIEVVIGNVFGSFLSPGLIYVLIPNRPEFQQWTPAQPSELGEMYGNVAQKLALTVILPLAVGQGVRILFEKQVVWCVTKLYLGKISTLLLCTLVWTTFSNAFKTGAIYTMPKSSILFNIFMNIGLYALFTVICFVMARPPHDLVKRAIASRLATRSVPRCVRNLITPRQMSKEQAIAVCFCGAAKTTGVGIPLVAAMWAEQSDITRAYIAIPVLLYTIEQVFMAQVLVYIFKWYLKRDVHSDLDVESGRTGLYDLDGADERNAVEKGREDFRQAGQRKT